MSDPSPDAPGRPDAPTAAAPHRYQPGALLGRGTTGEVREAWDPQLRRTIALKVMHEGRRDAEGRARFLREARITGQLEHPGVVPIHDAGIDPDGRPWIAMTRVDGRTLHTLHAEGALPSLRERLAVLRAITEAVAYAHDKGVVHRDLKSANVMIGAFGEVTVLDWGLGKDLAPGAAPDDAGLTRRGAIAGTPQTMSPEQARGEAVDARTDVYALGVMLWELLQDRPPRPGRARAVLRERAAGAGPDPAAVAAAPRELRALVQACTAADPAARPATARVLRDDLAAWLAGAPLTLVPRLPHERAARWAARNRRPLWVAAAMLLASAAVGAWGIARYVADLGDARAEAEARARDASDARIAALRRLAESQWALGRAHLATEAYGEADDALRRAVATLDGLGEPAWGPELVLARIGAVTAAPAIPGIPELPGLVDVTIGAGDTPPLAGVTQDGHIVRVDLASLAVTRIGTTRADSRGHGALAFRGDALTWLDVDGATVSLHVDGEPRPRWAVRATPGPPRQVGLAGARAFAVDDGTCVFLDASTGAEVARVPVAADGVVVDVRGDRVLVRSKARGERGELVVHAIGGGPVYVAAADIGALSPDGRTLYTAAGHAAAVALPSGAVLWERREPTLRVRPSPAGDRVYLLLRDRRTLVVDPATGETLGALDTRGRPLRRGVVSGDGALFAGLGPRYELSLWSTRSRHPPVLRDGRGAQGNALAVSGDGLLLAVGDDTGVLELRAAATGALLWQIEDAHVGGVRNAHVAADGARVLTAGRDGRWAEWAVGGGDHLRSGRPGDVRVTDARYLPDGRILTTGSEGLLTLIDGATGAELRRWRHRDAGSWGVAIGADGRRAWLGDLQRETARLAVLDLTADAPGPLALVDGAMDMVFEVATDGAVVAAATHAGEVHLWALPGREPLPPLDAHDGPALTVAASPSGRFLATGGYDGAIVVWRTDRWTRVGTLTGHEAPVTAVRFHPDGDRLFSQDGAGQVRQWRLRPAPDVASDDLPRRWLAHGQPALALAAAEGGAPLGRWEALEAAIAAAPGSGARLGARVDALEAEGALGGATAAALRILGR